MNPFESFRYASSESEKTSPYFAKVSTKKPYNAHKHGEGTRHIVMKCSICNFMDVSANQTMCSVCISYKTKKKQQEFNTMEFLLEQNDLKYFSQMNTKISCAPNADRPDFVWVLKDRVVILEVRIFLTS